MDQNELIKKAIQEIKVDNKTLIKEAIKEIKKEEKMQKKKNVYHNTELLMRHYNDFKKHYNESKSEVNDIKDTNINKFNLDDDELYILSIKRSKIKTFIMINHIEFALNALKEKQKKKGTREKYKALELYYVECKTYEEIAEKLNCAPISIRRWIKEMTKELSVFLFGIEALVI